MSIEAAEYHTIESAIELTINQVLNDQFKLAESKTFPNDTTFQDQLSFLEAKYPNDESRRNDELWQIVSRDLCRDSSIDTYKRLGNSKLLDNNQNYGFLITNKAWDMKDWNTAFVNPRWTSHTILMLNFSGSWFAVSPANYLSFDVKDEVTRMVQRYSPNLSHKFYQALEANDPRNIYKGNSPSEVLGQVAYSHLGIWPDQDEINQFVNGQRLNQLRIGEIPEMVYKPKAA